jgi:hypothetical protein
MPAGRYSLFNSLRTRINTGADDDQTVGGPLTELTKTVRNVRNEIRANFNGRRTSDATEIGEASKSADDEK